MYQLIQLLSINDLSRNQFVGPRMMTIDKKQLKMKIWEKSKTDL